MKTCFFVVVFLFCNLLLLGESPFRLDERGVLHVEEAFTLSFHVNYRSERSRSDLFTQSSHCGYLPQVSVSSEGRCYRSELGVRQLPDSLVTYRRKSAREYNVSYELDYPAGFALNFAALELTMPVQLMSGKVISHGGCDHVLPVRFHSGRGHVLGVMRDVHSYVLPLGRGFLRVSFPEVLKEVFLHDNRSFGRYLQHYSCRIPLPVSGRSSRFQLSLSYTPYVFSPVSLQGVCNRTLGDARSGDRLGGWTDQGPEQDLSSLRPGSLRAGGVEFRIGDDREGNSCIVLGGGGLPWLPSQVEVPLSGQPVGSLFLLHGLAWAPGKEEKIGELRLRYGDGSEETFPVSSHVDVGNWWGPKRSYGNGQLGWHGTISNLGEIRGVGLFVSVYHPSPKKALRRVTLVSNGRSVWGIAGVTTSPQVIGLASGDSSQVVMERNKTWKPYKPCLDVVAGSALDFSFAQDGPSGKYGRVVVGPMGDFRLSGRPEKPFRIWGTNLCFSTSMLPKREAERMVRNLRAFGYNAVRLHHFDIMLCGWGKMTSTIKADLLDRFFYTLYLLKEAGIYYCLDLHTARSFDIKKVPGVSWDKTKAYYRGTNKDHYNLAAVLLPSVREDLKQFSRNLLLPVNPYTGVALKDDPSLISISVLNENSMLITLKHPLSIEKELYVKAFEAESKAGGRMVDASNYEREFLAFGMRKYREYWQDMTSFLRDEIKTKALLTDQNFVGYPNLTIQREWYDLVDEHMYCGLNSLRTRLQTFRGCARRVFGKPFQISEFNASYPSPHRCESGLVYPAMAGLQGWDGLYRFAHSHRGNMLSSPNVGLELLDMANDPVRHLPERLAGMIFLRGDVSAARDSVVTLVGDRSSMDPFMRHYPLASTAAVFWSKVGSLPVTADGRGLMRPVPKDAVGLVNISTEYAGKTELPVVAGTDKDGMDAFCRSRGYGNLEKDATLTSSTGELQADFSHGIFKVTTPRTEGFYFDRKGTAAGKALEVQSDSQGILGATSLDGKALPESRRVLLLHVTDMQNEGNVYSDDSLTTLVESVHQRLPVTILYRVGQADVRFRTLLPTPQVYALDCGGRRLGVVSYRREGDWLRFHASTDWAGTACFAYEICDEP